MSIVQYGNKTISPSKIICVGRNYAAHAKELGNEVPSEPVIFLKPNTAIGERLHAVHRNDTLHYEGEICFMYDGSRFSAVGFGLDLTKRGVQNRLKSLGLPWEKAKAFDGAAVFSVFVPIDDIGDDLGLELHINGRLVQSGTISQMMFKPDTLLKHLSEFMTLNPGDIVMTGTPEGVGPIIAGDLFYAKILNGDSLLVQGEWQAI